MQRLKEAAEKAKKRLFVYKYHKYKSAIYHSDSRWCTSLGNGLDKTKFEALSAHLVQKTIEPMKKALADAGLSASDLNQVILLGGSTRIPAVQEEVKKVTGKDPHKGINPDECVYGAAIQAGVLTGEVKDVLLLDVTPFHGIETQGGVFTKLIERNTTIPTKEPDFLDCD